MRPKLKELLDNVENRIQKVQKSGPISREEFQLFVLFSLAALLQELSEE